MPLITSSPGFRRGCEAIASLLFVSSLNSKCLLTAGVCAASLGVSRDWILDLQSAVVVACLVTMVDPHDERCGGDRSGSRVSYPLLAGASGDAQASYNVMDGMALHIVYLFELSHMECLLGLK